MSMPKIMKTVAIVTFLLTVIFALLHQTAIAITCGTTCYHFAMRLFVGLGLNRIMQNHADYTHAWFRLRKWESSLYRMLRVRKWKGKFPTYDPDLFDQRLHSLDEIAQAMCQAEIASIPQPLTDFPCPIWSSATTRMPRSAKKPAKTSYRSTYSVIP